MDMKSISQFCVCTNPWNPMKWLSKFLTSTWLLYTMTRFSNPPLWVPSNSRNGMNLAPSVPPLFVWTLRKAPLQKNQLWEQRMIKSTKGRAFSFVVPSWFSYRLTNRLSIDGCQEQNLRTTTKMTTETLIWWLVKVGTPSWWIDTALWTVRRLHWWWKLRSCLQHWSVESDWSVSFTEGLRGRSWQ